MFAALQILQVLFFVCFKVDNIVHISSHVIIECW